ncbi:trypsin beta [Drosophila biarmipes]|uniref:trypsin beta n=1 Tax=Drosophila biarmipes TaxID=125945 RepID=UPI0021CCF14E|nr:trypsin beta [Drosophila biarmipes]
MLWSLHFLVAPTTPSSLPCVNSGEQVFFVSGFCWVRSVRIGSINDCALGFGAPVHRSTHYRPVEIEMQGVLLPLMMWMIWIPGSATEELDLRRNPRIVGGHPSDVWNQPHMVNIRRRGNFECGGSLVSPRCVLTAAHCLKEGQPSDFVVRGGVTFLRDMSNARYVRKILLPAAYNRTTLDHDVALLQLQHPLQPSIAQPISLAVRSPRPGSFVRVSGWGLTDARSTSLPNNLQSVHVKVMPQRECRDLYRGYRNITDSMFCASIPGLRDACAADSGGPAVNEHGFLVGVVSWGRAHRCAAQDSPGVYSDVSYLSDWIADNMRRYC